jgi:hypothetical protein
VNEAPRTTLVAPGETAYVIVDDTTQYARRFDMIACCTATRALPPIIFSPTERKDRTYCQDVIVGDPSQKDISGGETPTLYRDGAAHESDAALPRRADTRTGFRDGCLAHRAPSSHHSLGKVHMVISIHASASAAQMDGSSIHSPW